MAINKVVYDNRTLIDLTADTTAAKDVVKGRLFHLKSGEVGVGTNDPLSAIDISSGHLVVDFFPSVNFETGELEYVPGLQYSYSIDSSGQLIVS